MAQVMDILARKGSSVHTVAPEVTVLEATRLMNDRKVGALVVTLGDPEAPAESDRVLGIFTERDVLTRVVAQQLDPALTRVDQVMTAEVAYCRRETDVDEVAAIMRQRRIRHLPVCDGKGGLLGLVSIGDVNAWHAQGQEVTISYLHDYILGRV
jgi:CBS domain-containing protein